MEVALPVASIISALVAIVLRRGPVGSTKDVQPTTGTLSLRGSQLVSVCAEDRDLVLDVFGGVGCWRGHTTSGDADEASVIGTPMLTFRASMASMIDAAAFHRLQGWATAGAPLDITVDVAGDSPLLPPTRIVLADASRSVMILAGDR